MARAKGFEFDSYKKKSEHDLQTGEFVAWKWSENYSEYQEWLQFVSYRIESVFATSSREERENCFSPWKKWERLLSEAFNTRTDTSTNRIHHHFLVSVVGLLVSADLETFRVSLGITIFTYGFISLRTVWSTLVQFRSVSCPPTFDEIEISGAGRK